MSVSLGTCSAAGTNRSTSWRDVQVQQVCWASTLSVSLGTCRAMEMMVDAANVLTKDAAAPV